MLNIYFLIGACIGTFLMSLLTGLFFRKYDAKSKNLYSVLTAYPIMIILYNLGDANGDGIILAKVIASTIPYGIASIAIYLLRSLVFKDKDVTLI
tara:strand:+ start:182 stop:466 length:285 start_codon:yes stop_codon:yes gene_type:complete